MRKRREPTTGGTKNTEKQASINAQIENGGKNPKLRKEGEYKLKHTTENPMSWNIGKSIDKTKKSKQRRKKE